MLAYYKLLVGIAYVKWGVMIGCTYPGGSFLNRVLLISEHSNMPEFWFPVTPIGPLSLYFAVHVMDSFVIA